MTRNQALDAQRAMNRFSGKYLKGVAPLIEDGVAGHATRVRTKSCKFYLGYGATRSANSAKITAKFLAALRSPKARSLGWRVLRAGAARRTRQRARHRQQSVRAAVTRGVGRFDGKPCASWLIPYLQYARRNGWRGQLNSGWRSPAYSDQLCRQMCGAPSCPGRCAGRASNHAGSVKPRGAVDVSDYATFGRLMKSYPSPPRIFNALGSRDPVHFSASGR
jgi:hypothetical protein